MPGTPFASHSEAVRHWLGLLPYPPDGLHGAQRGRLVRRHTRAIGVVDARTFGQALARAYHPNRERRLMHLLRPQRLDDELWRQIYAVMVQGGPVWLEDLEQCLADLTNPDRKVADAMAVRLWQKWELNGRYS